MDQCCAKDQRHTLARGAKWVGVADSWIREHSRKQWLDKEAATPHLALMTLCLKGLSSSSCWVFHVPTPRHLRTASLVKLYEEARVAYAETTAC